MIKQLGLALNYPIRFEYAREYLDSLDRPYTHQDLKVIGEQQQDQSAQLEPLPILCDTDAFTLKVWQDMSFPNGDDLITPILESYQMDKRFYLLLEPDLNWKVDPLREHPDLEDRQTIYEATKKLLNQYNCNYVSINGHGNERLKMALQNL